ncbi:MAG: tetratricopeptide repeat protein [Acidobacteria bacterium]|nr:tetratricopeptide repeat protein [Acidobacteriota bacterium]
MKSFRPTLAICAMLIAAIAIIPTGAFGQPRGTGRVSGKVVDEQGKAVQDATVTATKGTESHQPLQTKTNSKGEWTITGVDLGPWILEISKEGMQTQKGPLEINDERMTGIKVTMVKAPEKADPNIEINAELQRAAGMIQANQFVEARKVYEDLLAKYPTVYQLHPLIARTYAAQNQNEKAIEHIRLALEKDASNADMKILLADLLMEKGDKDEAQKLLDSVDISQVKDPLPFVNAAISHINAGRTAEAIVTLDKLVQHFPNQPEPYYYRARAYIAAQKMPEAKADLEKFIAIAKPDAREMPDAKKILEQLSKK